MGLEFPGIICRNVFIIILQVAGTVFFCYIADTYTWHWSLINSILITNKINKFFVTQATSRNVAKITSCYFSYLKGSGWSWEYSKTVSVISHCSAKLKQIYYWNSYGSSLCSLVLPLFSAELNLIWENEK